MNKIRLFIIVFTFTFLLGASSSFAQCTCMGGAAVGGITPVGNTAGTGILQEGQIKAAAFIMNSGGNSYLRGDRPAETGPVSSYDILYSGIILGYGITRKLTLESETGYFINKTQDFGAYTIDGNGLSHITLSAKYSAYYSILNRFEITAGLGCRIPLDNGDKNLPQHLLPSTGAYGAVIQLYIRKGFKDSGLNLYLIHRSEISTENDKDYTYGPSLSTSLFATHKIYGKLSGIVGLRNENRLRDEFAGKKIEDSGGYTLLFSPQLAYSFADISMSALLELPVYRYYFGHQLAAAYSFALSFSWQPQL